MEKQALPQEQTEGCELTIEEFIEMHRTFCRSCIHKTVGMYRCTSFLLQDSEMLEASIRETGCSNCGVANRHFRNMALRIVDKTKK